MHQNPHWAPTILISSHPYWWPVATTTTDARTTQQQLFSRENSPAHTHDPQPSRCHGDVQQKYGMVFGDWMADLSAPELREGGVVGERQSIGVCVQGLEHVWVVVERVGGWYVFDLSVYKHIRIISWIMDHGILKQIILSWLFNIDPGVVKTKNKFFASVCDNVNWGSLYFDSPIGKTSWVRLIDRYVSTLCMQFAR